MLPSALKVLLGACAFLDLASLGTAQQYVGENITTTLPLVPGSEITYFNIKDSKSRNTTLINYVSLNSKSQRPDPKSLKRAVIVVHGLNRDPGTYMSNMLSALAQVTGRSDVNTDSVAIVAPYFANGDDKTTGYYPWDSVNSVSTSSALVWRGSQWASGATNQYPSGNSRKDTISSFAALDQLTAYYDNKTLFPNLNQIVVAGHSLGAQTVQRYCEVGTTTFGTPVVYWVGNPNSFGWMSTDRPVDYSTCSTYDDWRDGLNAYTNTYGATLVASGRDKVLANYNTKRIAYARGTLDLGDDSSTCAPGTTGVNRNERFFNFIKAFPPVKSLVTIDYVKMGHDGGGMFASDAGRARLFLDNFDGSGSKAYDYGYPRIQAGDDPYPDPSQSSDVAAVAPGTFSGMTYQGCYSDQSPSALSLKAYSRDDNTIELCTATCAGKGYKIAGLEYGSECWCGNSMSYNTRKTVDQGCTKACSGNANEICGDSYRLSVFSTGNVTIDTKPVSPTQVGSYSLLGCYSEATSGRALSAKSTSKTDMTVENCASFCAGYTYFGVEYGAECYCGNTVACSSVSSLATNCTMTCAGNSTEYCGNGGYLNMYALPSATGPSACPSSTSTSITATTTLGVSSSVTTSASTSATALACPAANGITYTTKNNKNYLIECYTDHYAGDMLTVSASTLELCIDACDANTGCVDVAPRCETHHVRIDLFFVCNQLFCNQLISFILGIHDWWHVKHHLFDSHIVQRHIFHCHLIDYLLIDYLINDFLVDDFLIAGCSSYGHLLPCI
ncbi:wsc-domain-containing protein [Botryosphaeria dothidea]|uniref:Wsc-domain-containing protein n=1 Tax=Botryosphaeria dothidea TaxID=55169 RepID=A0A8H4IPP4_9PEZI|nr:wsc-domain-containing protein [Botryosphaeria dothidea]